MESNDPAQKDLTGFSHGTSGVGWALLELHARTGDTRYRHAAEQAFLYERFHFDSKQQNWPDFRNMEEAGMPARADQPSFGMAWCHGAPGIGLARLRASKLTADSTCREETETALATTSRAVTESMSRPDNFSLCHGAAGNCDTLIEATRILGEDRYLQTARQVGHRGIEQFEKNRLLWSCGVPGGAETPNLMLGTAGIGYFYLRLSDPDRFPSVLILGPE